MFPSFCLFCLALFHFFTILLLMTPPCESIQCLTCASTLPNITEEDKQNCISGTGLTDLSVDCEAEGWGQSCITRTYAVGDTDEVIFLRSCVSPPPMTCEEGYMQFGDNDEVWTACCDTDNCNDYDPRDVVDTPTTTDTTDTTKGPYTGQRCYQCSNYDEGNTEEDVENCAKGINLEDKIVNCEEEGWGSSCIARVLYLHGSEKEFWVRSCLAPPPMTCNPGEDNYSSTGTFYTLCCDDDLCNGYDPRDNITTSTSEMTTTEISETTATDTGITCVQCASNHPGYTDEEIQNCINGTDLEDTAINCEEEGWGGRCIVRVFWNGETQEEIWLRSCLAPEPMYCDEGHEDFGEAAEYWTSCCDDDYCNTYDPRDVLTTTTESTDDSTPIATDGLKCVMCSTAGGQGTEEDIANCELGLNLEGTAIDCEANGWGSQCIARWYKQPDGSELWLRSCLAAPPMTCEQGHVILEATGAEYWTLCCEDDYCNIEDPRNQTSDTSTTITTPTAETTDTSTPTSNNGIRCAMCTTAGSQDTEEEQKNCEEGVNLEDTAIYCEANGWGSECIASVYKQPDGEELWIRSCLAAPPMTCEPGHVVWENTGAEYWTLCCEDDLCNTGDPRNQTTTTSTTTTTTTTSATNMPTSTTMEDEGNGCAKEEGAILLLCLLSIYLLAT